MTQPIDWQALAAPFPAQELEWRVQQARAQGDRVWVVVLPYVTSRAVQQRLDDVVGPDRWQVRYRPLPTGGMLCGIAILTADGWLTKWDGCGASGSSISPGATADVRGVLTTAMRRAAVQWGIGRYLYRLPQCFARVHERGRYRARLDDGRMVRWDPPELPGWALPGGSGRPDSAWHHTDTRRP